MSAFDFRQRPGLPMAPEWKALDRALYRWVLAKGGSQRLASLAAWCSHAEAQGHTALSLQDAAGLMLTGQERGALLGEPLCSDGVRMAPFVLDGARFYFWRNHAAEVAITQTVVARCASADVTDSAHVTALVAQLFAGSDAQSTAGQRAAVAAAAQQRLLLLSGGPGTGKTSTVLRALLLLQQLSTTPLVVKVAAPTGKAAQRLLQSLREGRKILSAQLGPEWRAALDSIPERDALTLHRLLEFDPRQNRYRRDADHRIAADVVVIDEASMVDLTQLAALLAALPGHARLVLVGDPDQLDAVAAGAVMGDLGRALPGHPSWQQLQHVFRAEVPLLPVLQAVRAGDAVALRSGLDRASDATVWRPVTSRAALRIELRRWGDGLAHWQASLPARAQPAQARAALHSLAERQLLCALREGEFGAIACHQVLEQQLRQRLAMPPGHTWYAGRAVMITRNDYASGLYNGDIGIALPDAEGTMRVWFEAIADADGVRSFLPNALPQHEGAFALTIHKSQGSEYDEVAVLLPPQSEQRILSRQLLYTGVSRARRRVELWAGDAALQAALAQDAPRASGLAERIAEGLRAG